MHFYTPKPGDVVLDVGAGKGEDTIAFSRAVKAEGRVIAIEAHPVTFRCLHSFCEFNHLSNVEPLSFAVAGREGTAAIESANDWQVNRIFEAASQGSVRVSCSTLDQLVQREGLRRIDFLKMNIEGAECQAMAGMKEALRITRALCISCHDFRADQGHGEFFRTKKTVQEAVAGAGFRILSRAEDGRRYISDQVNGIR